MVDDTPLLSCMASDGVSLSLASTTFELADVLGAKAAPPYVEVRCCGRPKPGLFSRGGGARRLATKRVKVGDECEAAAAGVDKAVAARYPARPDKVLVIVNPVGGTGAAAKVYERDVAPVLAAAGVRRKAAHLTTWKEALWTWSALSSLRKPSSRSSFVPQPPLPFVYTSEIAPSSSSASGAMGVVSSTCVVLQAMRRWKVSSSSSLAQPSGSGASSGGSRDGAKSDGASRVSSGAAGR